MHDREEEQARRTRDDAKAMKWTMEKNGLDIEMTCPMCGHQVAVNQQNFAEGTFKATGEITLQFRCPECEAEMELPCTISAQAAEMFTAIAVSALQEGMLAAGSDSATATAEGLVDEIADADVAAEVSAEAGMVPEAEAMAEVAAGTEGAAETYELDDSDMVDAADAEKSRPAPPRRRKPQKQNPSIRYMSIPGSAMVTFGIELNKKPQPDTSRQQVEYSPTDEDMARLEYFHRQLESLDTVDDAIDEIDSGYNFNDDDKNEGK